MPTGYGSAIQSSPQNTGLIKFIATIVWLTFFIIVGLTVMFGSWYTVDQTQRAVLLRNGAFVEVVQPGLHFKMPWVESYYKIDMQTHTKTYGSDPTTGKDIMEAYSADQQPAFMRVSVTMHVSPDKVQEMYSRFGGDYDAAVSRVITPHVYERAKVVFGKYTAAQAISNRGELNAATAASIKQSIAYDPVFEIESAQIENISFSQDYIHSVEQRMQAEVEVQKLQQNLAREKVQADIAVTQANGRANSLIAEATARANATKLNGDAEAYAIEAKAKALSTNSNLISLTQAEKWNGALPTTMVPGSAVPFISVK